MQERFPNSDLSIDFGKAAGVLVGSARAGYREKATMKANTTSYRSSRLKMDVSNGVHRHFGDSSIMGSSAKSFCAMRTGKNDFSQRAVASKIESILFFNFVEIRLISQSHYQLKAFQIKEYDFVY